jgi:hypothetical protein
MRTANLTGITQLITIGRTTNSKFIAINFYIGVVINGTAIPETYQ